MLPSAIGTDKNMRHDGHSIFSSSILQVAFSFIDLEGFLEIPIISDGAKRLATIFFSALASHKN